MNKYKFIKTKDINVYKRLVENGVTCYGKNQDGEWYFKNAPQLKFSEEDNKNMCFTSIMNM